jgi:pyrimidine nucleoside transport protein
LILNFSPERNIMEAASSGASQSVKLVANIAVNLIAFLSILEFLNKTLMWIGMRVSLEPPEYPYLTFEVGASLTQS